VARKRVAKKLKVTETTSQEVSSLGRVVEYLFLDVVYADDEILLLAEDPTFRPRRPRGVPEVDECGLAEIGNSKEETRGTQFRQVRAARCVIPYVLYVA
jgi:hypothetical protein